VTDFERDFSTFTALLEVIQEPASLSNTQLGALWTRHNDTGALVHGRKDRFAPQDPGI
jgi:hypothetical protein